MSDSVKRKRGEDGSLASSKKLRREKDTAAIPASIKVVSFQRPQYAPPVIATTPGIILPERLRFHTYMKKDEAKSKKNGAQAPPKELLLHSQDHGRMDYTAREDRPEIMNKLLKHYVGAFDPKTGELKVIEARKMIVRGAVRARKAADEAMAMPGAKKLHAEMRTDLGETFGTNKAKKALKSAVENAITSSTGQNGVMNKSELALMDSVKNAVASMATQEDLQTTLDMSRPVPKGNYEAEVIQEVYKPEEIIGADVLKSVPVLDWQEKAAKKEDIEAASRFVATRVMRLAADNDAVSKLRLLRYYLCVVIFWQTVTKGKDRGTWRIAPREKLRKLMAPVPDTVSENIRRKFSDNGEMRKAHVDLLVTHCCVFTCLLDNFQTNTYELREDLKLDQKELGQYFSEIGAKMRVSKKDGKAEHVAKLALPLQFPKLRRGRR